MENSRGREGGVKEADLERRRSFADSLTSPRLISRKIEKREDPIEWEGAA